MDFHLQKVAEFLMKVKSTRGAMAGEHINSAMTMAEGKIRIGNDVQIFYLYCMVVRKVVLRCDGDV